MIAGEAAGAAVVAGGGDEEAGEADDLASFCKDAKSRASRCSRSTRMAIIAAGPSSARGRALRGPRCFRSPPEVRSTFIFSKMKGYEKN